MSSQNKGQLQTYAFSLSKTDSHDHSEAVELNFDKSNCCPMFNHDRQYSTPAFLVAQDKAYYKTNITIVQFKFNEIIERQISKLQNSTHEKLLQMPDFAHPSSNFCQICKMEYSSYFDHLATENHTKKVNNSLGQKYIKQLSIDFQKKAIFSSFQPRKVLKNIKKSKKTVNKLYYLSSRSRTKRAY